MQKLVSDNGRQFISKELGPFKGSLASNSIQTASYHPVANGLANSPSRRYSLLQSRRDKNASAYWSAEFPAGLSQDTTCHTKTCPAICDICLGARTVPVLSVAE